VEELQLRVPVLVLPYVSALSTALRTCRSMGNSPPPLAALGVGPLA